MGKLIYTAITSLDGANSSTYAVSGTARCTPRYRTMT
jgi:hypothetical protein